MICYFLFSQVARYCHLSAPPIRTLDIRRHL